MVWPPSPSTNQEAITRGSATAAPIPIPGAHHPRGTPRPYGAPYTAEEQQRRSDESRCWTAEDIAAEFEALNRQYPIPLPRREE